MSSRQIPGMPGGYCSPADDDCSNAICCVAPATRTTADVPDTGSCHDVGLAFVQNSELCIENAIPSTIHDQSGVDTVPDLTQPSTYYPSPFSTATSTFSHGVLATRPLATQDVIYPAASMTQATPYLPHWPFLDNTTGGSLNYEYLSPGLIPSYFGPQYELQQNPGQFGPCKDPFEPNSVVQRNTSTSHPTNGLSTSLPQIHNISVPNQMTVGSGIGLQWLYQKDPSTWSNQSVVVSETPSHDLVTQSSHSSSIEGSSKSKARKNDGNFHISQKRARTQQSLSFEACLSSFHVESGKVQQRQRRPKLTADKRREYILQRNVGACHQCRFRKRACNLDAPCNYCTRLARQPNLAKQICYRDSPFLYHIASDYFLYTSNKRTLNFLYNPPKEVIRRLRIISIRPNDRGFYSTPLQLQVFDSDINALSEENRNILLHKLGANSKAVDKVTVINESDQSLGNRLERWALEYCIAFAKTQNHRAGRLLLIGEMWIRRKLPESRLVWICMRVLTLNYLLRTGVIYCAGRCTNTYRAVEARVDTVVYLRIKEAERELNKLLETIIWKSYGRLTREQLFPVAYVLWQYLRLMCLRVSHVTNLVMVYKKKGLDDGPISMAVKEMTHMYNLLLSVHTALFRSSSPLLIDFHNGTQHDILPEDSELIDEAMSIRSINTRFRHVSYGRHFRSARAFEQQIVDKLRKVLDGEGLKL